MCCFTGRVEKVDETNIFARMMQPGVQLLIYEMKLSAKTEVAMVLPIPVVPGSGDDAVELISMERYPKFFMGLNWMFEEPTLRSRRSSSDTSESATLKVHSVGAFVASFVPSLADFSRLDARFQMPEGTIDRVPEYHDYGFVVFQLAVTGGHVPIHPMAFEFKTRDASRLFFPTLHIHDGKLQSKAKFSHKLYAQGAPKQPDWMPPLRDLAQSIATYASVDRNGGMARFLDASLSLRRRKLVGKYDNADIWLPLTVPA